MAQNVNNPSYDRSVHKYFPCIHFHMIPVPRNSRTNFKLEGVNVTGSRYNISHCRRFEKLIDSYENFH